MLGNQQHAPNGLSTLDVGIGNAGKQVLTT